MNQFLTAVKNGAVNFFYQSQALMSTSYSTNQFFNQINGIYEENLHSISYDFAFVFAKHFEDLRAVSFLRSKSH